MDLKFLLLASLIISTWLAWIGSYLVGRFEGYVSVLQAASFLISFLAITLIFALIFKILPDAEIAWGDVWIGAAFTSLLFIIGKSLMGLYLGHSTIGSVYGAAGSTTILLL